MSRSSDQHRLLSRALFARQSQIGAALVLALGLSGCGKSQESRREPPPPPPPQKPAACASPGKLADAQSAPFFPPASGGYCLDPNGGEKTFGEGASLPLDHICDLFDGECEIYKGYGARRVVDVRYVDGAGTPATIEVYLSKFATSEGAYAMFTRRVVGEGDPAEESTPKPLAAGGAGALGLGNAYVWKGLFLIELTYNDEAANEAAIKARADKLLPALAKEVGDKLPGEAGLPPSAAALPKDGLLPLGVRFVTKDLLSETGIGPGAFGYYRAGDKRFRFAALLRADDDQAKDVLASLAKVSGAAKEKAAGEGGVRLMHKGEGAPVEWVFARAGKLVLGVGDEPRALRSGMSADEHAKVSLSRDEKIERLKKALVAP
ncbi:MAG: DUF6599 family protein [Byssovorax sp.]